MPANEFYRDLHKQEFDRRESLSSRGSGILAGLTTLSGAMAFLAVGFKGTSWTLQLTFWILFAVAGVCVLLSGGYLLGSYLVAQLEDIGAPSEWLKYLSELTQEYTAGVGKFCTAEEEYEDGLIAAYSECADNNIESNTKRGVRLVRSNFAMLAAFAAVLAAGAAYYYAALRSNETLEVGKVVQLLSDHGFVCAPLAPVINAATRPKPRPVPAPFPPPPHPQPPEQ